MRVIFTGIHTQRSLSELVAAAGVSGSGRHRVRLFL